MQQLQHHQQIIKHQQRLQHQQQQERQQYRSPVQADGFRGAAIDAVQQMMSRRNQQENRQREDVKEVVAEVREEKWTESEVTSDGWKSPPPIIPDEKPTFEYPNTVTQEIADLAAEVREEVSGDRANMVTDTRRPYDPNLVCPVCNKPFRIGEIQKYRTHVKGCKGTGESEVKSHNRE